MATKQPNELTAIEALEQIQAGTLTSEALVASCLERIAEREDTVGAWQFFSPEQALDAEEIFFWMSAGPFQKKPAIPAADFQLGGLLD